MKIRLYLDESSEKDCDKKAIKIVKEHVEKEGYCYGHYMSCARVDGLMFGYDEKGIFTEINTFAGGVPKNIQCFTLGLVTIYDEDRIEMYNAPLSGTNNDNGVESVVDTYYNSTLPSKKQGEFWRIRISGPTFEDVVNRYKEVRSGKAIGEVWTGEFVENVTSLAKIIPELVGSLKSIGVISVLISELLVKLEDKAEDKAKEEDSSSVE